MSRNAEYDIELGWLKRGLENSIHFPMYFCSLSRSEFVKEAHALCDKMLRTYEEKDTDYSENDLPMGNLRESSELGISPYKGVLLRIGDKKRRIGSFVKREVYLVQDEKVDDTFVDLANYSLLGLALLKEVVGSDHPMKDTLYDAFRYMAIHAIFCKLLYVHRDTEGETKWKEGAWEAVLANYNTLARFAKADRTSDYYTVAKADLTGGSIPIGSTPTPSSPNNTTYVKLDARSSENSV